MLDIEKLKSEYIGKEINWLTVIDIFRNDKNIVVFKCRCRCGKESIVSKKVILGNKAPISCGCYSRSKEYSDKIKQLYRDNPSIQHKMSASRIKWCSENRDILKDFGSKHSQ